MCYLVAHDKIQPEYEDEERSIVDRPIPKDATTEELEALGDTIHFIDVQLKLPEENYDAIRLAYITAMKDTLRQITQTMIKALTPKQKVQIIMTDIGGGWYMEKSAKGLPPLKR